MHRNDYNEGGKCHEKYKYIGGVKTGDRLLSKSLQVLKVLSRY